MTTGRTTSVRLSACHLVLWTCGGLIPASVVRADAPEPLPGTDRLELEGDLSALMRAGFDALFTRYLDASIEARSRHWNRDFSSRQAYEESIAGNRARLAEMLGVVDERLPFGDLELVATLGRSAELAEWGDCRVYAVRWPVQKGVHGEGLLLAPAQKPLAHVVWLPDADQTPEQVIGLIEGTAAPEHSPLDLVAAGCQVVIPVLVNRDADWSGSPDVATTNQTHREWIYRQAFTMGRHIIGYEVQKILALVDLWSATDGNAPRLPIGVAGYFEGGLLALSAAAVDNRIDAAWVSGYFQDRQRMWDEPLYRNVFGYLREFGDAELASLVAPRPLVIDNRRVPVIAGPPEARPPQRAVAAPGKLQTPAIESVEAELERAARLFPADSAIQPHYTLVPSSVDQSKLAASEFLAGLGLSVDDSASRVDRTPGARQELPDARARQKRQVGELVQYTQSLMTKSPLVREQFWKQADSGGGAENWNEQTVDYRKYLWDRIVGRLPASDQPLNPRTRKIYDEQNWVGYEVVLDVYPEVIAWGYLLIPKDIEPGERRPVVVCQHGLEGQPADVITRDPQEQAFEYYKGFGAELADRGFVVYAPHNFYRGDNEFRQLQRKAHLLGWTLFGLTTVQHQRHLDWLSALPFVDPNRIGFYGLSYGGNTAVRVPALLTQYAAVISSGDFNDWIIKNVTTDYIHSMVYHNVYEVFEWNLGHTFNHGDLAALIAPRPFMVERGHDDGVGIDEWVGSEYARVRRLYARLGIAERTEIEFFNGPHTIHGQGTYAFLQRHLEWPLPRDNRSGAD